MRVIIILQLNQVVQEPHFAKSLNIIRCSFIVLNGTDFLFCPKILRMNLAPD